MLTSSDGANSAFRTVCSNTNVETPPMIVPASENITRRRRWPAKAKTSPTAARTIGRTHSSTTGSPVGRVPLWFVYGANVEVGPNEGAGEVGENVVGAGVASFDMKARSRWDRHGIT